MDFANVFVIRNPRQNKGAKASGMDRTQCLCTAFLSSANPVYLTADSPDTYAVTTSKARVLAESKISVSIVCSR